MYFLLWVAVKKVGKVMLVDQFLSHNTLVPEKTEKRLL